MKRKSRPASDRYDRDFDGYAQDSGRRKSSTGTKPSLVNATTLAILGGVFILGIGVGIGFSSTASYTPENIATRDAIDRAAPNPDICLQYGASAMTMDARIFVTLNPFNVYVSQAGMRPGCVLRSNNWVVLEQRNLINSEQIRECKSRMNTFGYTGDLNSSPQVDCVYQNDAAKNLFLSQPGSSAPPPETKKF